MPILESVKKVVKGLLGTSNEANVKRFMPIVDRANALELEYKQLDDKDLRNMAADLRERAGSPDALDPMQAEAFALVREAADRRLGMWNAISDLKGPFKDEAAWGSVWSQVQEVREALAGGAKAWDIDVSAAVYDHVRTQYPDSKPPYRMRAHDVQVIGAAVLHQGSVAEMKTGEGKTLVASLCSFLNSLASKVHVITVNDYLAKRDAEWNAPTLNFLGTSVAFIQSEMDHVQRLEVYKKRCCLWYQ